MVVDRRQLKATIATLLSVLMHKRAAVEGEGGEMFELNQFAPAAEEEEAKPSKKRKAPKETRAKAAE
jgi:acetyl-CoA carboxylase carboxyl transferase subunit beta